jgi:hypothetical protein
MIPVDVKCGYYAAMLLEGLVCLSVRSRHNLIWHLDSEVDLLSGQRPVVASISTTLLVVRVFGCSGCTNVSVLMEDQRGCSLCRWAERLWPLATEVCHVCGTV